MRELLNEHFARLSAVEQSVLLWLAILREPVSIRESISSHCRPWYNKESERILAPLRFMM